MKATLFTTNDPNFIEIQFSHELPLIPQVGPWHWTPPDGILPRTAPLARVAHRMSLLNVGRFCVELPNARRVYREFLQELVVLDGIDAVMAATRYSLTIKIGRCFDRSAVFQSVAQCIHKHFYSAEPLQLASHETPSFPPATPADDELYIEFDS